MLGWGEITKALARMLSEVLVVMVTCASFEKLARSFQPTNTALEDASPYSA
jgi:hypothetical protein